MLDFLRVHRRLLHRLWLDRVLDDYPEQSRRFFRDKRDRFTNPVGHALEKGLDELLDEMAGQCRRQRLKQLLEDIIRIRVVQQFGPVRAVMFPLYLKQIVRTALPEDQRPGGEQLRAFDDVVEQMLLDAFETYSALREEIFMLRVNELKRSISTIIKRSSFFEQDRQQGIDTSRETGDSISPGSE